MMPTEVSSIPEGWIKSNLGDVCRVVSGSTPKTSVAEYWGGGIPWITPNDLSKNSDKVVFGGERSISQAGYDSCSTQLIPAGSVLFTSRAPIGYVAIAGAPMCTNQGFKSAIPGPDIDGEFLYWQLQERTDSIQSRASGTTFLEISGKGFAATSLVVPPLEEQREIVRILEEQFSRLNAAAASLAAVRRKADQFRRSLLHHKVGHLTSDYLQLDECASMTLGLMLDKGKESGEFQTRYLGNINVRWGSFDISSLKMMDVRPEQMERSTVKAGDIVVCEGGEPGRCAIWLEPTPIAIQKALHRVRPREGFLAEYLALILESEFRGQSQHSLFTGTTIKHLPKEKLRLVKIPNVPISEQRSVVSAFEAVDSSISHAVAHFDRVETGISAARRSLLQAAFTGELTKEWREKNNG